MDITRLLILPVLLLLLVAAACSRHSAVSDTLLHADEIIEQDPDSAMNLLESVDKDDLSGDDLAYYSLLYTQAQVKCGVVVTSDSLHSFAYRMYRNSSSSDLKKRAYFYNAQIAYFRGNLKHAMRDILVAYDISKKESDSYWTAKSAELISDIFFESYNYKESEIYEIEAVDNYLKAGRIMNHHYALCDLSTIYLSENKLTEGLNLRDSLRMIVLSESPIDSALIDYIDDASTPDLVKAGKYNEVAQILSREGINSESLGNTIIKSYLYHGTDDIEKAEKALSHALEISVDEKDRIRVLYASYRQALADEKYEKAALLSDTLLFLQSSLAAEILNESVTSVQRDYYSGEATAKEERANFLLSTLIMVTAIAVIVIVFGVIVYKLKMRLRKEEIESNIASIIDLKEQYDKIGEENQRLYRRLNEQNDTVETLQQELDDKSRQVMKNTVIVENLFRDKWTTLNMLCNEYFERGDNEKTRAGILKDIEGELKKFRNPKNLKQIEIAVDDYLGGIMALLRAECSFLKEEDFIFLSLLISGFSVRAVCLFTDIKYKLFYLKKSRLIRRIDDSNAPHKSLFLDKIK